MPGGGYREKSGRSKQGYYKGIYCGSTYELCWAIHALDHGIPFTRFPGQLKKDKLVYIPDFLLGDKKTIIEPKGYERGDSVKRKTELAESLGYIVKIMRKDDLKYAFEYVTEKYKTKKFHTLYDDYKPKYTYICSFCNKNFNRDNKAKNNQKEIFCNISCSVNYRHKLNRNKNGNFSHEYKPSLTKDEALYIFNEKELTLSQLAEKFNISIVAINAIKTLRTYKWIHDGNPTPVSSKSNISKEKKINAIKRLEITKNLLDNYKENQKNFTSKNSLALEILSKITEIQKIPMNKKTLLDPKKPYRALIEKYIQKQSQSTKIEF
jgi:hypothetical protein